MIKQHEIPLVLRQAINLLSGEDLAHKIPRELLQAADRARILDLLGTRSGLRKRKEFATAFIAQAALGAVKLKDLREIAAALEKAGIAFAPLKGMAYALMFEKGGPTRAMADIDLLVPSNQFEEASQILIAMGYLLKFPEPIARVSGYNERSFIRDGRLVDLHWAFLPVGRQSVDFCALWERTLPILREGINFRRLSPEDTFLAHTIHMGTHEYAVGLRPIWELWRLIRDDRPDLNACALRAREWGCLRMTWCALYLLEICFPNTVAPQTLQLFKPSQPIIAVLERFVVRPSLAQLVAPSLLPRHVQLLRKALLIDRLSTAIAYGIWYTRAWV